MNVFKTGDLVMYDDEDTFSDLHKGAVYEVSGTKIGSEGQLISLLQFPQEDTFWWSHRFVLEEGVEGSQVVSDGLSTSYYQVTITNKAGEYISCEIGDIIRAIVGNDFDLGNVIKASRRMFEASQGRGKKAVSIHYDANKIAYFAKEFADWHEES